MTKNPLPTGVNRPFASTPTNTVALMTSEGNRTTRFSARDGAITHHNVDRLGAQSALVVQGDTGAPHTASRRQYWIGVGPNKKNKAACGAALRRATH